MNKTIKYIIDHYIYFILSGIAVILFIIFFKLSSTVDNLSHKMIERTMNRVQNNLDAFFNPVVNNLMISWEQGKSGLYDSLDINKLNKTFVPLIKNSEQISSLMITRENGDEYMLLQMKKYWMNRYTQQGSINELPDELLWDYGENANGELLKKWKASQKYDSRSSIWFKGAMQSIQGEYHWTEPYIFYTTKDPGITVSTSWQTPENKSVVIAFDVLLTDISNYTTNLDIGVNGKVFILTEKTEVLGLPSDERFKTIDSLKKYSLLPYDKVGIDEMEQAVKHWKENNDGKKYFRFSSENTKWWGDITEYYLGNSTKILIGVIVPEKDFVGEIQRTRNLIIGGFCLLILFTIIISRAYNFKKKANKLLAEQNEEIREMNEEIRAQRDEIASKHEITVAQKKRIEEQKTRIDESILYAKNIQKSVLPSEDFIRKILGDYFIIFKPHSVVSGDFYWMTQIKEWTIVVAADCTGHGVPGAFMSMLGVSFLNEIVRKKEIIQPDKILNELRISVIEALKETTEIDSQKDGMDMSIVAIDNNRKQLQWAGANNPLWIVRKIAIHKKHEDPADMIEEIKADKMPVAVHINIKPFTNHALNINSGDRIFLFSDGFPDQFGGSKGKKYKYKPFKRIIAETSVIPINKQGERLKEELQHWMHGYGKNYEQIDDITVIGFEI